MFSWDECIKKYLVFMERCEMIHYIRYLEPPCINFLDKLIYLVCWLLTAIIMLPYSIFSKNSISSSVLDIYPKLMPKDLLISYYGIKMLARKGKTDILLLSKANEPWMD